MARPPPTTVESLRKERRGRGLTGSSVAGMCGLLCFRCLRSAECGGVVDGLADARIGSAAAEIAGHGGVDLGVGGLWSARQQSGGGEHLAGLAVAALGNVDLLPGDLDGVF